MLDGRQKPEEKAELQVPAWVTVHNGSPPIISLDALACFPYVE